MNAAGADGIVCETPRLILRQFRADDAEAVAAVLCDPEVMRFSPLGPETRPGVAGFLAASARRYARDGVGQWAVVLKETGALIGVCGISAQAMDGKIEHELGYRLAKPLWHQGIATEAAAACRDYGFKVKRLPRLIAIVQPQNEASVHVAEKIGMREESRTQLYGAEVIIYSLAAG